jgi:hypothetical protein
MVSVGKTSSERSVMTQMVGMGKTFSERVP